jgi:hypothetical protein
LDKVYRITLYQIKPEFDNVGPLFLRMGCVNRIRERCDDLHVHTLLVCSVQKDTLSLVLNQEKKMKKKVRFTSFLKTLPSL